MRTILPNSAIIPKPEKVEVYDLDNEMEAFCGGIYLLRWS